LIRIGDFARLGQTSVVTLRHYDEIGLLKPTSVDEVTGYRYYAPGQLARLNRIAALKDLGFSLQQIAEVLGGEVSLEQLRGMLKLKHAEVDRRISSERERLDRIAARLKQIESEELMSDYEVALKEIPAQVIASRRITIPTNDQVGKYLGSAFDEAYGLVRTRGAKEAGPCIALWYQGAEVLENEDAEAAVPIEKAVAGTDRVSVYELAGGQVASVIHEGDYANFSQAHAVLLSWIETNGYRTSGPIREVYIRDAAHGMNAAVTEIQYPVEKAG